jgi:hypothetical protein
VRTFLVCFEKPFLCLRDAGCVKMEDRDHFFVFRGKEMRDACQSRDSGWESQLVEQSGYLGGAGE